jgi:hypothetical protein
MRIRAAGHLPGPPEIPRLPEKRWPFLVCWLGTALVLLVGLWWLWKALIRLIL